MVETWEVELAEVAAAEVAAAAEVVAASVQVTVEEMVVRQVAEPNRIRGNTKSSRCKAHKRLGWALSLRN